MNKKEQENTDLESTQEAIKDLVVARLRAIPKDIRISIGSSEYSKEELIENVEHDSEIGREIIEIQMDYLRDLASGAIYAN